MGVAFDIISGRLQIDNSRWLSALQSSSGAFGRFINGINQAAQVAKRGLDNLANALTGIATAAAAAGAAGVKMGADYEQSMARVRAVTGATGAEFQKLDAYAKKLGIDTVYSAKDAADGMSYLAQGGYKVNQIMGAMRPVMDLAATAQVGVADASRILVNIMESMRIHVDELPHAVDVLAKAMTSGGNDMMEFGEAFKYVGPVAKAAGVSLEQTAATIQLLGKNGINASMGGTALRGMLSYLSMESPKLRKDFAALGIAVYDVQGKLKPLPDVIDQFNAALKDANRQGEATKLIMGDIGQRAGPGFLSLMQLGGDAIRKLTKEMEHADGIASRIAEIQISTLKNKWGQLLESLTTLGIGFTGHISGPLQNLFQRMNDWVSDNAKTVNDVLAVAWDTFAASVSQTVDSVVGLSQAASPALQLVWDKITGIAGAIKGLYDRLTPTQQSLLVTVGTLTAVGMGIGRLGGRIPMIGELVAAMGSLVNPFTWLIGALRMLWPLLGGIGAVILSPLGITLGVVAAAVSGLYLAFNKAYEASASFRAGVEKIKATVVGFIAYTRDKIGAWVDEHRTQFDRIADKANQVWETMKRGVSVLATWLGDKLGQAIESLSGGSLKDLDDAFGAIGKAAGLVLDALEGLVDFMDGDGRRLGMVALEVAKIWNTAMASILDAIASVIEMAAKSLDNPLIARSVEVATIGAVKASDVTAFAGSAAFGLRANANGLRSQANLQGIGADFMRRSVRASDKERNDDINRRRSNKQYADLARQGAESGGNAFYEAFFDPQKIEEQERLREKVRLEFDQENAAAEGQVKAEQEQKMREQQAAKDIDTRTAMSKNDTTGNKAAMRQAKTIASGVQKDVGSMFQFAAKNRPKTRKDALEQHGQIQQIQQFGMAMMQQFANIANLEGDARKKAVQDAYALQQQYQDLVEAFKSGKLTTKEFGAMLKKATKDVGNLGDQAKKAGDAEKELADEDIAKLNAQGVFTPQQQQAMQQQAQQAQQQMQQFVQPLIQQLQQQAQAAMQGAAAAGAAGFNGDAAQGVIDAAKQAKTPQEALQILKGYYQAQAGMTLLNIKNVAATNDPIMGSFGGQYQGANNLQYVLSQGGPAVETYKQLLAMIDAIDAKLKTMPHMASGGIVDSPTIAMIGESGPEAVLPLGKFGQWFASAMGAFGNAIGGVIGQIIPMGALQNVFGNPMGIFGNQGAFRINPGGFSVNPLGLNMGNLGAFDSMFGAASMILNQQADLGNTAALGILDQWSKVQQTAEDAIGFMRQHRRIDLGGHSGFGGRLSGYGESTYRGGYGSPFGSGFGGGGGHQFIMQMNVSGVMTQADISRAFDQFENESRRRGADGLGRSRLRSGPYGQITRGPLAPAGVPH